MESAALDPTFNISKPPLIVVSATRNAASSPLNVMSIAPCAATQVIGSAASENCRHVSPAVEPNHPATAAEVPTAPVISDSVGEGGA